MENDQLRPEWRGLMLLMLRIGIVPLARGVLPYPITSFTDSGIRERFSRLGPAGQRLVEQGRACPVELMEAVYALEGMPLEGIKVLLNSRRVSRVKKGLTRKDAQQFSAHAALLVEGLRLNPMWGETALGLDDPAIQFFGWYFAVNIISLFQWYIPFPFLYFYARDGTEPTSQTALLRAISTDKTIVTLPWVSARIQDAAARNDKQFLQNLGQALKAATVPKPLRADAIDYFLCTFHTWLEEMSLSEQAEMINEGGLRISVKTLRNRRSRLGLSQVDLTTELGISDELNRQIRETQERFNQRLPRLQRKDESTNYGQ